MGSWMFLPERKLKRVNKFVFSKESIKPVTHQEILSILDNGENGR